MSEPSDLYGPNAAAMQRAGDLMNTSNQVVDASKHGIDAAFVKTREVFESFSHQDIYDKAQEMMPGIINASAHKLQQIASEIQMAFIYHHAALERLFAEKYHGDAADAALAANQQLVDAVNEFNHVTTASATRMHAVANAAEAVKHSIPAPHETVDAPAGAAAIMDPKLVLALQSKKEAQRQEAVQKMNAMYKPTYFTAGDGLPSYGPPPQVATGFPGGAGGSAVGGGGGAVGGGSAGGSAGQVTSPTGGQAGAETAGRNQNPAAAQPAAGDGQGQGGSPVSKPEAENTHAASAFPGQTSAPTHGFGSAGGSGGGGFGGGGAGLGGSGGVAAPIPAAPGGPGVGSGANRPLAAGLGSAGKAGGAPGMPGMPQMPGGKGKKDSDYEHKTADYLRSTRNFEEWVGPIQAMPSVLQYPGQPPAEPERPAPRKDQKDEEEL